ncbi:hypothetical protein [Planctellipticum variicoloris]|uniref:hypothetical protein n=1 Tax=Planctellipticum variicoloris TaxID=3064265 RepID=UPI003013A054|nr:hypothetical protein SH412_005332 [Planctomycetaceae bacterium SH412]
MIHYAITADELYQKIDACNKTWRQRAQQRTGELRAGTRTTITGIWSEIKSVYMEIQGPKCAFCEREIEAEQAIECDVEHFRPKNRVSPWAVPEHLVEKGVTAFKQAHRSSGGYTLLAYHPLNYIVSCKTCNTTHKGDRFPTYQKPLFKSDDPTALTVEKAYLIYPLSDLDDKPEDLIAFFGISPKARRTGFSRLRALVTIDFFGLDETGPRTGLLKSRAERLEHVYFALRQRDSAASSVQDRLHGEAAVARLEDARSPHANAVRSFVRLWSSNRSKAEDVYDTIHKWLATKSR